MTESCAADHLSASIVNIRDGIFNPRGKLKNDLWGSLSLWDLWGSLYPLVHKLSPSVDKLPQRSIGPPEVDQPVL